MAERVVIFDTTLRDGEQSPGASMNTAEKLRVAQKLKSLGVDVIEAGFPIASPGDFEAVKTIAAQVRGVGLAGLARCQDKDIDAAWQALALAERPRIHVFLATSPIHMEHKLKMTPEQVLEAVARGVARAKKYTPDVEFSAEDASRSEPAFLARVFETAIRAGATTVNAPDTVGYALPREYAELIRYLKENVPNIDQAVISVHCHDDLGLAVSNTLAAIEAGARQVEVTVNGIGERAGNAALEEVAMCLATRRDILKLTTGLDTSQIYPVSRLVSLVTGIQTQPNKAVVGANAFAHEAGIHQDGVLKNSSTYEIMRPETVGWPSSQLVLGKHSGRHAFKKRLVSLGYEFSDGEVETLFAAFKELADKKKAVYNEDIEVLIAERLLRLPETYQLSYLNVMSGTHVHPVATVELSADGQSIKSAGFGVGPVDAVYKTIMAMTGSGAELVRFSISATTGGMDAQGEVTVRLREGEQVALGRGADQDILIASAKALVNGLNRLEQLKRGPIRRSASL